MTLKQYNWKNGPDLIQQHSVAKHRILQAYLAAYFRTLVSSPNPVSYTHLTLPTSDLV